MDVKPVEEDGESDFVDAAVATSDGALDRGYVLFIEGFEHGDGPAWKRSETPSEVWMK